MIHTALKGNMEEARALETTLAPFFSACFCETNPIPIKTAMSMYGWCAEEFRLPMCSLEQESHRDQLLASLATLDVQRRV